MVPLFTFPGRDYRVSAQLLNYFLPKTTLCFKTRPKVDPTRRPILLPRRWEHDSTVLAGDVVGS